MIIKCVPAILVDYELIDIKDKATGNPVPYHKYKFLTEQGEIMTGYIDGKIKPPYDIKVQDVDESKGWAVNSALAVNTYWVKKEWDGVVKYKLKEPIKRS